MSWKIASIKDEKILKSGFKNADDAIKYVKENFDTENILDHYDIFEEQYAKRTNRE